MEFVNVITEVGHHYSLGNELPQFTFYIFIFTKFTIVYNSQVNHMHLPHILYNICETYYLEYLEYLAYVLCYN